MQFSSTSSRLLFVCLLLAVVAWPYPTIADPYSGLSDPGMDAYRAAQGPTGTGLPQNLAAPSSVPRAPVAPGATTRPANWPTQQNGYPTTGMQPTVGSGAPVRAQAVPKRPADKAPTSSPATVCQDARVLARVGTESVLAGEVIALFVNVNIGKLKEPIPDKIREDLLKNWLPQAIVPKLMYVEAKRSVPAEQFGQLKDQIRKYFTKEEVPRLMKEAKLKSVDDLEKRLAELGTSLAWQERLFVEKTIGQQWMITGAGEGAARGFRKPIRPEELLAYYREHLADYEHTARARWEELTVNFSSAGSKREAWNKLASLGNEVLQGRLPFAEAAKRGSDGVTAADGGEREWIEPGTLACEKLDHAVFGLPVGRMSPIIESDQGFHIIRVIERKDACRTPFTEVQDDIRKKFEEEHFQKCVTDYIAELKKRTRVWSYYDQLAKKKTPTLQR